MAEIINLRNVRKQKARADKEVQAAQNRALFGRSVADRMKMAVERAKAHKHLDDHKKDE